MTDWSADFEDQEKPVMQDWSEDFGEKKVIEPTTKEKVAQVGTMDWQVKNLGQGVAAASGLYKSAKKGAIQGAADILSLPFELFGGLAYLGEELGSSINRAVPPSERGVELTDYAEKRLKEEGLDVPERYRSENENFLSRGYFGVSAGISEVGDKLTELSVDDFQPTTYPEKAVERVTEYASPGAVFTQGLVNVGKKVIKEGVENPSLIQRMTTEMAKDPAKAHKVEQAFSAMAATSGQTAEELGAGPGMQFLTEILGTVGAGSLYNGFKRFLSSDFLSRWQNKRHHAEVDVGEFFDAIFKHEPDIKGKIQEGQRLSKEHGVEMNLGELAENPEIQAAGYALESRDTGGITELGKRSQRQTEAVGEIFEKPTGQAAVAQATVIQQADEQIAGLKNTIMDANEAAIDEATNIGNLKGVEVEEVGQSILNRIDEAEDLARAELNPLYEGIDLTQKTGSKEITTAIREARDSLLPNNQFKGELESHLKSIFNAVTGKEAAPKTYGTKKPFTLNRDAKDFAFTVGSIQELQGQLKRVIREERSKGNNELVRSLSKVLSSTYDQLDTVAGPNVDRLKTANAKAREVYERFNDTRIRTVTRTDLQGDMKVAPEDIVNTLVKSNKEKGSIESVNAYKDAIKDQRLAREQLFNAFAIKLRNNATVSRTVKDPDGTERVIRVLDPKKVQSEMDKHSNFLRASNITIKNPDEMAKRTVFAQQDLNRTISENARDSLMKWANSDTPVKYVMTALENNKLKGMMAKADELTKRGIREALWEGLFESTMTPRSIGDGTTALSINKVSMLMQRRGDDLLDILGKKHYNSINDIIKIVNRISGSPATAGRIAGAQVDEHLVEKVMTGLRAAAHGFVRPDLIIAQATARAAKAMNTIESQNLLREAMNNPEMALRLADAAKDVRTRPIVYTMFTPLLTSTINLEQSTE